MKAQQTSVRKRVVETYIEWDMPPYFALGGRAAFEGAIENDATPGLLDIQLTRLVEEGDVVVAEGAVRAALKAGGQIDALFCGVGGQTSRAFEA